MNLILGSFEELSLLFTNSKFPVCSPQIELINIGSHFKDELNVFVKSDWLIAFVTKSIQPISFDKINLGVGGPSIFIVFFSDTLLKIW